MTILKWLWNPVHYWLLWFYGFLFLFAVREFWALGSGRSQDTFSYWVWNHLKIIPGETVNNWSAEDFLVFGVYCTVFTWLAFHFFLRRFT